MPGFRSPNLSYLTGRLSPCGDTPPDGWLAGYRLAAIRRPMDDWPAIALRRYACRRAAIGLPIRGAILLDLSDGIIYGYSEHEYVF